MLWNSKQKGYDLDDLIQLVETSNRQKRVVQIVERCVTRVSEPNVSLVLKSAIVNILNGYLFSSFLEPQDCTDFHEKKNIIDIVLVRP